MNDKEHQERLAEYGLERSMEEHLQDLVYIIIGSLYKLDTDQITVVDPYRLFLYGLDKSEPINWHALGVSVIRDGDKFTVIIDEAAPNECPVLCNFVQSYLKGWGWDVEVITEW